MATTDSTEVHETPAQAKGLTLWPATALVTGTIIGAGIFTQPSWLAQYGPISILGFAITAFGSLMLALVFASLARRTPDVGGPYAFSRQGFGDFVGFQSAWTYWIGAWVGVGAIASSLVVYLGVLIPPVVENRLLSTVVAVGAIAVLTFLNTQGVVTGGLVSLILTILKVVPLLLIGTLGFIAFDASNLGPFNASGLPPLEVLTAVMAYTLFSFIGVEAATIPAGDVHEPDKTIPRATMIGTIAAAAVYLLSTTAVFGAVEQSELANSDAAFSVAAANMFGDWASDAVAVVAVISCLGAMNGLLLLSGQIPMAAEFDGLAPKVFGKLNIRHAPGTGLIISGLLAAGILALSFGGGGLGDAVAQLVLVSAVATMVSYAFSAGAEIKWLALDKGKVPVSHIARKMAVAVLALVFTILAFYGGGVQEIYWLWMLIVLGVPLYIYILWRRASHGESFGGEVTPDQDVKA
ncbi:MAG TPA: amino acid permease [Actinomycetota bacterium]|jgi:APA family basic amino acid/polyamine antiporter|nr:amino acid permease [Actinomycetota bacterium]HNO16321.1 amino acid permease [Actinomycetota bacterium]HUM87187.1 amino acid permease [Actinomycetota bacterium]